MKKSILIASLILLGFQPKGFAQSKFNSDKLYFGGNFGASFGLFTYVDVSPLVGYRFTERFTAGVGATYIYLKSSYQNYNGDIKNYQTSIYGGRIFGRYYITENIFAHVEEEILNGLFYEPTFNSYGDIVFDNRTINNTYIGGGYQSRIGMRSGAFILLLYNLNSSYYSKQLNPSDPFVIRIGFNIGL